jgi:hypothetical protein
MRKGRRLNLSGPIKTTRNFTLDSNLFRQIREECDRLAYPFSNLTEDLLRQWMESRGTESSNAK